ncbi:putative protein PLEKHA9 [Porphyridium purpureum]|uniref:Glycolipid transfer protein domain-containing protein n=1 Tax=Porphyridium purpureum TaxID=35688 RepID=A0A5J4YFL2_PORPP|nr:putative protein PLEKHA9 [Porphyridium purpureum]|eukprot:POR0685..scf269_36
MMREYNTSDTGAQKLALFGFALAGTLAVVPLLQWIGCSVASMFQANKEEQDKRGRRMVDSGAVDCRSRHSSAVSMYEESLLQDLMLVEPALADVNHAKQWQHHSTSGLRFAGLVEKMEKLALEMKGVHPPQTRLLPLELFLDSAIELLPVIRGFQAGNMPLNVAEFLEKDISKNVRIAREESKKHGATYVQQLVKMEMDDELNKFELSGSATECLMWLKRTFQFVQNLIHELVTRKEPNLHSALERSYDVIYAPVHPFFLRPIVKLCFGAFPSRTAFLEPLGGSEGEVIDGLTRVLTASNAFLYVIVFFFRDLGLSATDVHDVIMQSQG